MDQEDPAHKNDSHETWLWFSLEPRGKFHWQCVVCHGDDLPPSSWVQKSILAKHQTSPMHARNLQKQLHIGSGCGPGVPSTDVFRDVLKAWCDGLAPGHDGYALPCGVGVGHRKAKASLWCINEAHNDNKRQWLRDSTTINLLRDERHARLHVRFRCAALNDPLQLVHAGYLGPFRFFHVFSFFSPFACFSPFSFISPGQCRSFEPDAIGLTAATVEVCRSACSKRVKPPEGAVLPEAGTFDNTLFAEVCNKVEAVTLDSAASEVLSARDMSTQHEGAAADFPNAKHVLRDAAHNARRVLSRLFDADSVLKYTLELFMILASLIQWSDEMRKLYQECVRESQHRAVVTMFEHMRYAKHRIESWLTPLSRCCLDPEGRICFSSVLCIQVIVQ